MSAFGLWLVTTPIWLIGIVLYGGMLIAALTGWLLRGGRKRKTPKKSEGAEDKDEGSEIGYIVSAVMGLLALLVGFTFSMAVDRFDNRRSMVLAESNAIGTAYLRTQLIEEPHRSAIGNLLKDYTENRIVLAREPRGPKQQELLARSNAMITQLWSALVDAYPAIPDHEFASIYIESINEMIDDDAARQQSRRSHVPLEVFVVLLVYQFVAAGVFGYVLSGERGRLTAALLLVLFGSALLLIIDLDRATGGGVVEDNRPMQELFDMMKAQPPGSFGSATRAPPTGT